MATLLACASQLTTCDEDPLTALRSLGSEFAQRADALDSAGRFALENFAALRRHRLTALAVPAELGGHGLAGRELCAALTELAGCCASTALAFAMHTHQVAIAAWRWRRAGAPVAPLLQRVASEGIWLLSTGGADWLDGSGTATRVDGGYLVSGVKSFVSGAAFGDLLNTTAVATGEAGRKEVLHFAVPMTEEGIRIVANWDTLGMRASGSESVHLDRVFVADAAITVRRPAGQWHPALHLVSMIALPLVYSVYLGVGIAARARLVERLRTSASAARAAPAIGELDNELRAAELAQADMVEAMQSDAPGMETTLRVMTARVLAARALRRFFSHALDVGGGASFYRTAGLERSFRDIQASRYHPLQEHVQQELAGRLALGLPT